MGGRRVLEIGKEGCQQESGIPEHLVTGSRQNMSCWGPSYLYPACHYQGPQSSPRNKPRTAGPFSVSGPFSTPPPPQLMRRERNHSGTSFARNTAPYKAPELLPESSRTGIALVLPSEMPTSLFLVTRPGGRRGIRWKDSPDTSQISVITQLESGPKLMGPEGWERGESLT